MSGVSIRFSGPRTHESTAIVFPKTPRRQTDTLKSLIKIIVSYLVQNDFLWGILDRTVVAVARYAEQQRGVMHFCERDGSIVDAAIGALSPKLQVKHGPFKGMKYPSQTSIASSLFPKLLGTYESELRPVVEEICNRSYDVIVNVGCAEGYYAVGLAIRIPEAKVYAYDISRRAISVLKTMARINNVDERITTGFFCDEATLKRILPAGKALIVSDCEGYEINLFTEELVPFLANHDLLVEVHDCLNIEIASSLSRRFARTHEIVSIKSVDDITKAHSYVYEELADYDLATRKILLAESRPTIMEWFYMKGGQE
jgi:hypothetical protein